ncbi:uncharacterized protein LOC122057934 [Macadamia integrifolia]|uniref:uncharacterized protein LOC122057934 n=1 Tax=Macadamia integrifolia TaxID=60698 RepID=UPI001C530EBA|nr:uncharacterized protein LOC122057934 [Macadamia integrifolia]
MALEMVEFSIVRTKLKSFFDKSGVVLFKSLLITGSIFYLFNIFFANQSCCQSPQLFTSLPHGWDSYARHSFSNASSTDISHIVFGVTGSINTWRNRRHYIEEWWQPNITRGYVWLDRIPSELLPWSPSSPPYRVSTDTTEAFKDYNRHGMPDAIRMTRVILEAFRESNESVRWYVITDDDTVILVENLVELLARYDHNRYYYIGRNSESISANDWNSFEMAFGGAAYALSYPLVKALVINLDECIKRYPTLYGSDHILQSCIIEFGVSLTHERGFHQIDLHRNIWGFLSAHPQTPLISLHHIDVVEPIFPSMDRHQSLKHLMEAAKVDSSRLLQQTICYHKKSNWSFSISWGYSAQIYEKILPPSVLQRPLQTFLPWSNGARLGFMFNTRPISNDPCEAPHVFFFGSVERASRTQVITNYTRSWPRDLPTCLSGGNHSADSISEIRVFSPVKRLDWVGRRECCDIVRFLGLNITEVRVRGCKDDEIVA